MGDARGGGGGTDPRDDGEPQAKPSPAQRASKASEGGRSGFSR